MRPILLTHSELRRALRGAGRGDVDQRALIRDFPAAVAAQENAPALAFARRARMEASWRFWCDLRIHHGWLAKAVEPAVAAKGFVPYPVWVCNPKAMDISAGWSAGWDAGFFRGPVRREAAWRR